MDKQKTALWFLTSSLIQIDKAIYYFQEYLNTKNKDYWVKLIVPKHFDFCLIQIWDRELMPEEDILYLITLIKKHEQLSLLLNKNNIKETETLNLFYFFRNEILNIFFKEIKSRGLENKIKTEMDIKEATNYSEDDDYPEFLSSFFRIINTKGQSRFLQEDYL